MLKDRKFIMGLVMGGVIGGSLAFVQPLEAKKKEADLNDVLKEMQKIEKHVEDLTKDGKSQAAHLRSIDKNIADMANRQSLGTPKGL